MDFTVSNHEGKIAFEIDGTTWHNPSSVSEDKYTDDLLKQLALFLMAGKYIGGPINNSKKFRKELRMNC